MVFIAAAPDILFCKDTDGDGKADWREVVFTGFGRGNVQGLVNSLTWGLDNRIYGSSSKNGGAVRLAVRTGVPIVPIAIWGIRQGKIRLHQRMMTGLFVGGLLVAGALNFLPGRLFWSMLFG